MGQTQIISPWVFYWIDVLNKINVFSVTAGGCALFLVCLLLVIKFMDPYLSEDEMTSINKATKWLTVISILCLLVAAITPAKSTMYKMLIANEITYERAETVIQVIDEKVEAIISSTKEK